MKMDGSAIFFNPNTQSYLLFLKLLFSIFQCYLSIYLFFMLQFIAKKVDFTFLSSTGMKTALSYFKL